MRSLAALVGLALLPFGAAALTHGTITPGRGAAGVTLGMTRAQVVAKLGRPSSENAHGYMEYGKISKGILFDVYLDVSKHPARVRLIGISGPGFCLVTGGPCLMTRGGVGKLRARYDGGLQTVKLEDGERVLWLKGRYRGCKVFTDFGPAGAPSSARIVMVFVGFQGGSAC